MTNLKMKFLEPTRSMWPMRSLKKSFIALTIMDDDAKFFLLGRAQFSNRV